MMKSVAIHTIIYLVAAMALGSCLKDDIPYPHIQANFRNIEAEGVTAGPVIDSINRMVTLTFPKRQIYIMSTSLPIPLLPGHI